MMKKILSLLLLISCISYSYAQTPHLSGKVQVNMNTGQITCDFVLSNIPDLGKDYEILLNKGFNIKAIRDSAGQTITYSGFYAGKMRGEGLVYTPQLNGNTLTNPKKLRISYTGAFPIYTDTLNFLDFKGLIAFNGKTMRATDQSKWYPIIYDVKKDRQIEQMTYNIEVSSNNAKMIFVNGDLPKPGPTATFKSTIPIAPMLFMGDYGTQQTAGALFINTEMNNKQLEVFEKNIAEMKAYYFQVLKIPYDTKNIFIEHQPVEKFNQGRSWGFVAFPTIAFAGLKLGDMVDEKQGGFKNTSDYPFIAHEIAHYYFGNVLQPNSTLMWFFLESTSEYLSVKASEAKFGKQFASAYFARKAAALKNFKAVPLNQIKDFNEVSGTYRYDYGPFLLRGLEQIIGEVRLFKFLNTCLKSKDEPTNYEFFKKKALESGIALSEWTRFEKEFIQSENATALIK